MRTALPLILAHNESGQRDRVQRPFLWNANEAYGQPFMPDFTVTKYDRICMKRV